MRKTKAFVLFFLFVLALIITGAIQAQNNPYMVCGVTQNTLNKLFTNAQKIKEKCLEVNHESNKAKSAKKAQELSHTNSRMGSELIK